MIKRVFIEATTLADAWFQALYDLMNYGRAFTIDRGSYAGERRLEFDWVDVHIRHPCWRDALGQPSIPEFPESLKVPPPVTQEYLRSYVDKIMGYEIAPDEQYTYGSRLCRASVPSAGHTPVDVEALAGDGTISYLGKTPIDEAYDINVVWLDQIEWICHVYRTHGHRNNQMVLQVAQPSDLLLEDPPCLRSIDTRIQDDRLHFFPYFRSWDLWGGFPANLAGLSFLQEYMASQIGVEPGEMICTSKGLHLYEYAVDLASVRCHRENVMKAA